MDHQGSGACLCCEPTYSWRQSGSVLSALPAIELRSAAVPQLRYHLRGRTSRTDISRSLPNAIRTMLHLPPSSPEMLCGIRELFSLAHIGRVTRSKNAKIPRFSLQLSLVITQHWIACASQLWYPASYVTGFCKLEREDFRTFEHRKSHN